MGQKVNPLGFRIGIREPWRSRWTASKKDFPKFLEQDQQIRRFIKKEFRQAAVARIDIERTRESATVIIHTARPGVLIGRKGVRAEQLRDDLARIVGNKVTVHTVEIGRPELSAQLVAESVAEQLEKRVSFRRALKKTAQLTMQAGAIGVKLHIAGRLGGAEMSRREALIQGSIKLATLDADIDYGFATAATNYGSIGCKCWIFRGWYEAPRKAKEDNHAADA
ncbi:MAG: 30S ribosomal protein S3 [Planctomycetes bacterium]|nr:30S ribosomal protein S3 [Planctomycetota bacterium]